MFSLNKLNLKMGIFSCSSLFLVLNLVSFGCLNITVLLDRQSGETNLIFMFSREISVSFWLQCHLFSHIFSLWFSSLSAWHLKEINISFGAQIHLKLHGEPTKRGPFSNCSSVAFILPLFVAFLLNVLSIHNWKFPLLLALSERGTV